jgi:hypothetical protein
VTLQEYVRTVEKILKECEDAENAVPLLKRSGYLLYGTAVLIERPEENEYPERYRFNLKTGEAVWLMSADEFLLVKDVHRTHDSHT